MHHSEILAELYGLERFGIKLGLTNITDLLHRIGDPQRRFKMVHVTGTGGKGSVCAFVESVLREAGFNVGIYTSPHLIRFNERIKVGGWEISDEDIVRLYELVEPHASAMARETKAKQPTFFEITTAMAFQYFAEREVELAVVEVGMGGGMDATNVAYPEICILTRISLEHTEQLGKTIRRIAREKSGIMKPGIPAVTLEQEALPTIQERAREIEVPLYVVGRDTSYRRRGGDMHSQAIEFQGFSKLRVETSLLGAHQAENAAIALTALDVLEAHGWKISDSAKLRGIARTRWPARFQIVRRAPVVVIDGAHNPSGVQMLVGTLEETLPGRRIVFVIGVLNDKDLQRMAESIAPLADIVVATRPKSERAYSEDEIASTFSALGTRVETSADVGQAIERGLSHASKDGVVCIAGSIYMAGEALLYFQEARD